MDLKHNKLRRINKLLAHNSLNWDYLLEPGNIPVSTDPLVSSSSSIKTDSVKLSGGSCAPGTRCKVCDVIPQKSFIIGDQKICFNRSKS